jgi:hypothetical protein
VASVPEDLITYTVSDSGTTETAGTDIFEGPPPELPEDLVAFTHYAGESALDRIMGSALTPPGVEVALVQLFVRNSSMSTAKTKADVYHALLDGYDGTISGRKYFNVESIDSMPYSIGQTREGSGPYRYVCNFRIEHAR